MIDVTVALLAGRRSKTHSRFNHEGARKIDTITKAERSALMSRIRGKDTKPERTVRSLLHKLGYRFRIHCGELPGRPDIVLPRHRKIVLIHGCFWHGHSCKLASKPKSNTKYWRAKLQMNRARDLRSRAALSQLGWMILELWECEVRKAEGVEDRLRQFMSS